MEQHFYWEDFRVIQAPERGIAGYGRYMRSPSYLSNSHDQNECGMRLIVGSDNMSNTTSQKPATSQKLAISTGHLFL